MAALDCTDSARLLNPDGLEAAAPGATSAEALVLLLQGGAFTVTWLPTGRALPLGGSSALTPTAAEAYGGKRTVSFSMHSMMGVEKQGGGSWSHWRTTQFDVHTTLKK